MRGRVAVVEMKGRVGWRGRGARRGGSGVPASVENAGVGVCLAVLSRPRLKDERLEDVNNLLHGEWSCTKDTD